jgi:hypothetical protein
MEVVGHEAVRSYFKGKLRGALLKLTMHLPDDIVGFKETGAESGANCRKYR